MGLPRKFKKTDPEAAEGLEAVETQIAAAERLRDDIAKHREELFRATGCMDENGAFVWTEELSAYGAARGYATLLYLAERGDRESAKWLAEKGLGAPEQPFAVQVQHLSPDQAEREIYALLTRHVGPEQARKLAVALAADELPQLEEGDTDE